MRHKTLFISVGIWIPIVIGVLNCVFEGMGK